MIQIFRGGAATSRGVRAWKRCMYLAGRCKTMRQVKALHGTFIVHGIHKNNYAISKVLALIAQSNNGGLSYASLLFNQIETPNSFICNTLIRAYSRSSKPQLAIGYFRFMAKDGNLRPDNHTFHFVLVACANACWVRLGKQIQNWVVKNGLVLVDGHVQTGIVRLYVQCGLMHDARKSFEEIPQPDVVQWNVLIDGYVRHSLAGDALGVFRDMLVLGVEPDEFCVTTALAACARSGALMQGKWIHEYVEKRKCLQLDVFVGTALVDMYAKCGCIDMAVEVFEGMPRRNAFSWAAMIGGFAVHGDAKEAIHCLERMQVEDGLRPDGVVLLGVLMACTHAGLQEKGQSLLENMEAKYRVVPRHEHYSCMVDLLCRAGQLKEAILLINKMPMKPQASVWGAVLSSCRTHKNVEVAELAVQELLQLENGNEAEEDAALVQLSNIYLSAKMSEDAHRIRRMISDRKLRKTPGCSMVEVDGTVNEFVSGDAAHRHITQILGMLELLFADSSRLVSP